MKDKVSGQTFYRYNFSGYDFNKGDAFDLYKSSMFPNLKDRIDNVVAFNRKNYNMADLDYLGNVGKYPPGSHAEVRALDDLAKFKFPNYLADPPTEEVFDAWLKNDVLGYNRNMMYGIGQDNVIQHTCADCFYILDLITFIRP